MSAEVMLFLVMLGYDRLCQVMTCISGKVRLAHLMIIRSGYVMVFQVRIC
jgi:hypothetical protein